VCSIKPLYEFEILPARLDKAVAAIRGAREKISRDTAINVFFELGFGDAVSLDEKGEIQLNLTDTQLVAASYAILAVSEAGGKWRMRTGAA